MAFLGYREISLSHFQSTSKNSDGTETEMIGAIGGGGELTPGSAMLIAESPLDSKQIIYREEVPAFYCGWVERRDRFGSNRWHRVNRLEIKVARAQPQVKARDWILVSELPYSSCVVAQAMLKPIYKGANDNKPLPDPENLEYTENIVQWLDGLRFDYWETDRFLTAGFANLDPPPDFIEQVRTPKKDTGVSIGLCHDYQGILETLLSSDDCANIRDSTLAGKRRWWKSGAPYVELRDEVRVNIEAILDLSVRQAMAGPHSPAVGARLLGTPVLKEAGKIFDDHVNRLNRQVAKREDFRIESSKLPTETGQEDSRFEGFEDAQYQAIAQKYNVDIEGAIYITGVIMEHGLSGRTAQFIKRVMRLLAKVWRLRKPDQNSANLRAYIEEILGDDDVEELLGQVEQLVNSEIGTG